VLPSEQKEVEGEWEREEEHPHVAICSWNTYRLKPGHGQFDTIEWNPWTGPDK
jgi:hypothetical protein